MPGGFLLLVFSDIVEIIAKTNLKRSGDIRTVATKKVLASSGSDRMNIFISE